jgi:23S rRNA (guanosine2251-2'-O)-methyltransferase
MKEAKKLRRQEAGQEDRSASQLPVFSAADYIYGKNSVLEALTAGREINKIIIAKSVHSEKINKIVELAKQNNVVFSFETLQKYNDINHQGVIAFVSPIKYADLDEFLLLSEEKRGKRKEENSSLFPVSSSLVILDGIEDPHNFGAIIRTALCAGVDGIIIPSHRNARVTSIVEKTSAGAINHIPIIKVNSLSVAVEKLKNNNWWVIAADASAKDNYYNIDYADMNFALIMGAEGKGVSKPLLKAADFTVKIPMLNNFNSLNVSCAFSAIIFESVRRKNEKRT